MKDVVEALNVFSFHHFLGQRAGGDSGVDKHGFAFRSHSDRRIITKTVNTSPQKIRPCETDFSSDEAISIEESARRLLRSASSQ